MLIAKHFSDRRRALAEKATFDLYSSLRSEDVSFVCAMSRRLLENVVQTAPVFDDVARNERAVAELFELIRTVFAPWIEPAFDGARRAPPFNVQSQKEAELVLEAFVAVLQLLYAKFRREFLQQEARTVSDI